MLRLELPGEAEGAVRTTFEVLEAAFSAQGALCRTYHALELTSGTVSAKGTASLALVLPTGAVCAKRQPILGLEGACAAVFAGGATFDILELAGQASTAHSVARVLEMTSCAVGTLRLHRQRLNLPVWTFVARGATVQALEPPRCAIVAHVRPIAPLKLSGNTVVASAHARIGRKLPGSAVGTAGLAFGWLMTSSAAVVTSGCICCVQAGWPEAACLALNANRLTKLCLVVPVGTKVARGRGRRVLEFALAAQLAFAFARTRLKLALVTRHARRIAFPALEVAFRTLLA